MLPLIVRTVCRSMQHKKNTHESVKFLAVISSCLGLLPVEGVAANTASDLYFTWKSPKVLYCFTTTAATTAFLILTFLNPLHHKSVYQKSSKYNNQAALAFSNGKRKSSLNLFLHSRYWFSSELHTTFNVVPQCC